jgi:aldehyde dehydrogenase (NAD+)
MTTIGKNRPTLEMFIPDQRMIIGSERLERSSGGTYIHHDPASGRPLAEVALAGAAEIDQAATCADEARRTWRNLSPADRAGLLYRLADLIAANAVALDMVAALEGGIPLAPGVGRGFGGFAERWFRYYAGWADKLEGQLLANYPVDGLNYTLPEPYGVVGIIIPWNGPIGSIGMKVAPALAAGNTVVLKPPELSPFAAIRFGELVLEAGIPPGVVNVVPAGPVGGEALIRHPKVAKVSFTGGTATAKIIAATAADSLTPLTMELGGKSANIIFPDADLAVAVPFAVMMSVVAQAGQGCALPTRLFVHDDVYDQAVEQIVEMSSRLTQGDPLDPATEVGPVISAAAAERILGVITRAKSDGAGEVLIGGSRCGGALADGYFIEPTVFGDVDQGSHLAQEEIFGPVLSISRFGDEEEVVELANCTKYGLAAYLWTRDIDRAHRMAEELDAGMVSINGFNGAGPNTLFGGNKASGYGREGGKLGLDEFIRPKNVFIGRTMPHSM